MLNMKRKNAVDNKAKTTSTHRLKKYVELAINNLIMNISNQALRQTKLSKHKNLAKEKCKWISSSHNTSSDTINSRCKHFHHALYDGNITKYGTLSVINH